MKKLYIVAALLMATGSAHAGNGISFEIEGQRIRIEAPRNCDSLSCIKISAPGFKGFKSKSFDDDDDVASTPAKPAAPTPVQAAAPVPVAPVAAMAPVPAPTTSYADRAPTQANVAAPAQVAVMTPSPQTAPVAAATAPDPTSPLGVWATEDNKGNVRIEPCGANLCGYSVKSNERILISMKPSGAKWTGQIHDPDSGRNYDSTIALKGTDTLRVQGCAFGGMFCGGQTWKRVS